MKATKYALAAYAIIFANHCFSAELVCSNASDCAPSFNEQIKRAAEAGERLHLRAGQYIILSPITLPPGYSTHLYGDIDDQAERSTRILNNGTGPTFNYIGPAGGSNSTIHISHLVLHGSPNSGSGIYLKNVSGADLSNLWIRDHGQNGIHLANNFRGTIANNMIYNQRGHGVYLQDSSSIKVIENGIERNGQNSTANYAGVFIDGAGLTEHLSYTHTLIGNEIEGNGVGSRGFGVGVTNSASVNLIGNHFESNAIFHVWVGPQVAAFNAIGNFFLNNKVYLSTTAWGSPAAQLTGAITGNTFRGSSAGVTFATGQAPNISMNGNSYLDSAKSDYGNSLIGETASLFSSTQPTVAGIRGQVAWNTNATSKSCAFWIYNTNWICGATVP